MGLRRVHWIMIAAAALVVVLLSMAPRTLSPEVGEGHGASQRVSEDPNSGSTPHAHGPSSKDPRVAAIGAPPMQTILKLRDLADAEPTNAEAQYHLGFFSWQTGQYDKAMERFKTTIALDATGYPDAYAFLGQAYATLDSSDQALTALETYKTLVNDPELLKEADAFILAIKKKNNP